jgi:hypothetical protein
MVIELQYIAVAVFLAWGLTSSLLDSFGRTDSPTSVTERSA